MNNLSIENSVIPLSILAALLSGYLLYFRLMHRINKDKPIRMVFLQKIEGIVLISAFPLLIFYLLGKGAAIPGLHFRFTSFELWWSAALSIALILLNYFATQKADNWKMYPQIRLNKWTPSLIAVNAFIWIIYLLAYELAFRSLLLFLFAHWIGLWPAIAVNVIVYALVHLPKGIKEAIGAIPFGIILCLLCWQSGSFLIAFVAHLALALSNDYFSVYHNPNQKFALK